jgi:hypothetical protein
VAHLKKFTRSGLPGIAIHYERRPGHELENKDIHPELTYLNYNLVSSFQTLPIEAFVSQRCKDLKALRRDDVNVMCNWAITLPSDIPRERSREFFEICTEYLVSLYGKENIVGAWVHMDETTPHLHFSFVPVYKDKEKGTERVNAKMLINIYGLRRFHPVLKEIVDSKMKLDSGILNGATEGGNKTVLTMKVEKLTNDLKLKNQDLDEVEKLFDDTLKLNSKATQRLYETEDRILELTRAETEVKAEGSKNVFWDKVYTVAKDVIQNADYKTVKFANDVLSVYIEKRNEGNNVLESFVVAARWLWKMLSQSIEDNERERER